METVEQRQAFRQTIAAKQNAEVEAARRLLGPALAYGNWLLHDTTGMEPDRIVYCCRREGIIGWQPTADEVFAGLLGTRREDGFEHRGEFIRYMRYQVRFWALVEYRPMDPAVLQKRNETRVRNAAERRIKAERQRMPLLAEQIS